MVLAAGYGTRLKPLTDRVPKPLVPVAGKPMIQYALDRLQAYGIEEVVINVSHLKEQLTAWLAGCKNLTVKLSEEAEPLETGGGLKKALPLLGNEPVFIINSDIIWTDEGESALDRLARHWDDAKMDFLLLAQSKSRAVGHDKGEDHLFIKPGNTIEWNARGSALHHRRHRHFSSARSAQRAGRKILRQSSLASGARAKPALLPAASRPLVPDRHAGRHRKSRVSVEPAGSVTRAG